MSEVELEKSWVCLVSFRALDVGHELGQLEAASFGILKLGEVSFKIPENELVGWVGEL